MPLARTRVNRGSRKGRSYQGGLSQLRPVSVTSQLSTALPPEKRAKIISDHVARSPLGAWVPLKVRRTPALILSPSYTTRFESQAKVLEHAP
jgi:hypothetical protein